ncbi:hypothetical protein BD410DRAFT_292210 [Rickenella mellea]|uniref:Uncharacterized protein n=1 Tax=Rickenella mellea TaxID=50990 RepID=A0A4Y7Q3T9_9AGAM|nr:hypothetical protein BD410DRAFT_292210 [Rickenella mellea]
MSMERMDEGRHSSDTEVRVMEDFQDTINPIFRSSSPKIWTATPLHPLRIVLRAWYTAFNFFHGGSGMASGSKHTSEFRRQAGGHRLTPRGCDPPLRVVRWFYGCLFDCPRGTLTWSKFVQTLSFHPPTPHLPPPLSSTLPATFPPPSTTGPDPSTTTSRCNPSHFVMGFAYPNGEFHHSIGPLRTEDIVPCDQFRYYPYLDNICESQETSDTTSDGSTSSQDTSDSNASSRTSIELQQQQVDPFTAEILAQLEIRIQADNESQSQASQAANDGSDNSASHVLDVGASDDVWQGPEGANAFYRHAPSCEETARSNAGPPIFHTYWTAPIDMARDIGHPPTGIELPQAENVETTTCQSQSVPDSTAFGDFFACMASSTDVDQVPAAAHPSASLSVDVPTTYHSECAIDSSALGSVQNNSYVRTSAGQEDVNQLPLTIPSSGLETPHVGTGYNSQSTNDWIESSTFVQYETCAATSTGHGDADHASTTLSVAPETTDAAVYPSQTSVNPVATGYFDQTALSTHQNAASSYYTPAPRDYPPAYGSSDPLHIRSQVPQSFNSSWDNTSNVIFQQYDVSSMVPQGSMPMSMLYTSMGFATLGGEQQYGQMAGLQPQHIVYPSFSAFDVVTTSRSQSAVLRAFI